MVACWRDVVTHLGDVVTHWGDVVAHLRHVIHGSLGRCDGSLAGVGAH